MELGTGIRLFLDDGHAQPRGCQRVCAREPPEARADDDAVGVDVRFGLLHGLSVGGGVRVVDGRRIRFFATVLEHCH